MTGRSLLGDRCENHDPVTAPVVYPWAVGIDRGRLRGEYRCECGREWPCWWDMAAAGWTREDVLCHGMDCRECESQIRLSRGTRGYRMRIIHAAGCPWYAKHLAKVPGYLGAVPCSTVVTHRGPYKRDPEGRQAA